MGLLFCSAQREISFRSSNCFAQARSEQKLNGSPDVCRRMPVEK